MAKKNVESLFTPYVLALLEASWNAMKLIDPKETIAFPEFIASLKRDSYAETETHLKMLTAIGDAGAQWATTRDVARAQATDWKEQSTDKWGI